MTLPEATIYAQHGWTITRIAWRDSQYTLRLAEVGGRTVLQASPGVQLTTADCEADDWVKIAQVS